MVKGTAKDEWKGAMSFQLKDSTIEDGTNVTKVDVHMPPQRDSRDAFHKKKNCGFDNKPKKIIIGLHLAHKVVYFFPLLHLFISARKK